MFTSIFYLTFLETLYMIFFCQASAVGLSKNYLSVYVDLKTTQCAHFSEAFLGAVVVGSTTIELWSSENEDVGSNPAVCLAFFFSFHHWFCVLYQVPRGSATNFHLK